jgi:uncharacterized repeat protein (TIGR03803 family)
MKTSFKSLFLLPALICGLDLTPAGRVAAQTFTTLHNFAARSFVTNSEGAAPNTGLITSGNTLYGTAQFGGSAGNGTVFALNTDGTGFTTLYGFTAVNPYLTNSDGCYPNGRLLLSGNTLYGTSAQGGANGSGTVFKLNTDGTGFTTLYSFSACSRLPRSPRTNSDGCIPVGGLVVSGDTLYGTASLGGTNGNGTVFKVNTNGTGFTTLYSFASFGLDYTNSDGANPRHELLLLGNTLYGAASAGGSADGGTLFALNTDGTGFRTLYSFTARSGPASTNSDGVFPRGGLILSGNTLYGTAEQGGTNGYGTVFSLNTNGTGFTTLYCFAPNPVLGNSDGCYPNSGLILFGNTLYGTAEQGGTNGLGTVFSLNTNGTGFTTLYAFSARSASSVTNSDGCNPNAGLLLSGNTLYGVASSGGANADGTVFSLSYPSPRLTLRGSGSNVNLTWPSGVAGFSYSGYGLQSTTNLASPAVWTTNSSPPVVVNGQNTVTNPISETQMFFRLSP